MAGTPTMRAAVRRRWGRPRDVVELADVPRPELALDRILVRVRATSINRGDVYACKAPGLLLRPLVGGLLRPKQPLLGGDFAGVVEAVGRDVDGFAPGDEVFGSRTGAFAEYVAAKMLAHKPAGVSFEVAAAVPVAALTALQALRDHGRLRPGGRVLVNGASGAVGTFAPQVAKALGASHVTAVCSPRNVEQASMLGADRVVDYTQEDYTRDGEPFDVIVDVAGSKPWSANRRVLRPDGTLVLVGVSSSPGNVLIGPLGHVGRTWLAARRGSRRAVFFVARFNEADLNLLRDLLERGAIRPVVERRYPFERIADALAYAEEGHARGKLVVTIP